MYKIQVTSRKTGAVGFLPRRPRESCFGPEARGDPKTFKTERGARGYAERGRWAQYYDVETVAA